MIIVLIVILVIMPFYDVLTASGEERARTVTVNLTAVPISLVGRESVWVVVVQFSRGQSRGRWFILFACCRRIHEL